MCLVINLFVLSCLILIITSLPESLLMHTMYLNNYLENAVSKRACPQ